MKLIEVHYETVMANDSNVTKEKDTEGQWTFEKIKTGFAEVFKGDGCLEGRDKTDVSKSVKPVQLPKRPLPVTMMKPQQEELQHWSAEILSAQSTVALIGSEAWLLCKNRTVNPEFALIQSP